MKSLSINHIAVLAAVALHAMLLTVQMQPQPLSSETVTRIAIRLVTPYETPVVQVSSPPSTLPRPLIENKIQNHEQPELKPQSAQTATPTEPSAVKRDEAPAASPAPPATQVAETAVPLPLPAAAAEHTAPAPVATPTANRLPDYLAVVRNQVESHKDYPAFARQLRQQGTVTVRVTIAADGRLREAAVGNSSGHPSLDKAALAAVRNSGKFRAPDDFGLGAVTVDIPITYKLI